MSERYGWTPIQIAEMTLAQILVYWLQADDPGTVKQLSLSEAQACARRRHAEKQWLLRHIKQSSK